MLHKPFGIEGRRVRLYGDLPYPDETWASFVDRTARSYKLHRAAFFFQLTGHEKDALADLDLAMPPDFYGHLLDAFQVSEHELPRRSRGVSFDSLPRCRRVDYCPLCFVEDLAACRTPYFRYQWAIPIHTSCHVHGVPLMPWRAVRRGDERVLPFLWTIRPNAAAASQCPWLDEDAVRVSRAIRDRSEKSALELIDELSRQIISFRPAAPHFSFNWNFRFGYSANGLIAASANAADEKLTPLAVHLRPRSSGGFFGAPAYPYRHEIDTAGRAWSANFGTIAFRRSLLWFAARTVLGANQRIYLHDGRAVRAGGWEPWWDRFVLPAAGKYRTTKMTALELQMHQADQWSRSRGSSLRYAA